MKPPETIRLLWCPTCGHDDRMSYLSPEAGRHYAKGLKCSGKPIDIIYEKSAPPVVPPRPQSGYRAAVEMSATITPSLPHLTEDTEWSRVGRVYMLSGSHPEQLAMMIQIHLHEAGTHLANKIAPHPRPDPHDGWLR